MTYDLHVRKLTLRPAYNRLIFERLKSPLSQSRFDYESA